MHFFVTDLLISTHGIFLRTFVKTVEVPFKFSSNRLISVDVTVYMLKVEMYPIKFIITQCRRER